MNYRDLCFSFYWKMQSLITPTLKYSQSIYEETLFQIEKKDCLWLDLGCGHQILPSWRHEKERELIANKVVVGLDYDYESLKRHESITNRVRGDVSSLPFADNSFDLITANMVFEHLDNPEKQLKEILRALKPGGTLLFHTPNALGYGTILARLIPESIKQKAVYLLEKREENDIVPTFYRINSINKIKKITSSIGFDIKKIKLIVSTAECIIVPPLAILELLFIRLLMTSWFRPFRTNIIAICEKQQVGSAVLDKAPVVLPICDQMKGF